MTSGAASFAKIKFTCFELTCDSEPHAHGKFDPYREYKLKSIVGENAKEYLISWEDDEITGEVFVDTWEPKRNANRQAIEDWEKQKAEKKRL